MTSLIVIPTHRTGVAMLENLLKSFKGFDKYPILVVICDYKKHDEKVFRSIKERFLDLPISWEHLNTNSFELGGSILHMRKLTQMPNYLTGEVQFSWTRKLLFFFPWKRRFSLMSSLLNGRRTGSSELDRSSTNMRSVRFKEQHCDPLKTSAHGRYNKEPNQYAAFF